VPVYLHGDDRAFVTRPHSAIVPWTGDSHRDLDDICWCGPADISPAARPALAAARKAGALAHRRCRDGGDGSPLAQLHVQLSELHSAQRRGGAPDLGRSRAAGLRSHLRRVVGPQHRDNAKAAFEMSIRRYIAAISG
jgi:hypothetical protein